MGSAKTRPLNDDQPVAQALGKPRSLEVDMDSFDLRTKHEGFQPSTIGTEASTAKLGAASYATGNEISFKKDTPLDAAAHEAAHVVQQRGGK
jgi:hypothetical protein